MGQLEFPGAPKENALYAQALSLGFSNAVSNFITAASTFVVGSFIFQNKNS